MVTSTTVISLHTTLPITISLNQAFIPPPLRVCVLDAALQITPNGHVGLVVESSDLLCSIFKLEVDSLLLVEVGLGSFQIQQSRDFEIPTSPHKVFYFIPVDLCLSEVDELHN